MAKCNFCQEKFQSEQGVRGHLKKCEAYLAQKEKKARAALGTKPQGAAAPDLSVPKFDFIKSLQEQASQQDAPPTPPQQRRTILQAVKKRVIGQYVTPFGQVTASMRGHAKLMIERALAPFPLEDLGIEEACEIAAAIRDGLYVSAFHKEAREAERQRVAIARFKKEEVAALGDLLRADRRKKMVIYQANQQADAFCQEKKITGWAHVSVLADVESQLETFLTGDEPILEAQAIARSVLEDRFAQAESRLAAARTKANEQWREEVSAALALGTVVGLSLRYPEHTVAFFTWLEGTFGVAYGDETGGPNPEASEPTSSVASAKTHPGSTRRNDPIAPEPPFHSAPAMQGQA